MNFALLGADEDSLSLVRAAVQAGHDIVWCGDVAGAGDDQGLSWLPSEDWGDQWEALLDNPDYDAVIVGRGSAPSDVRAEQVNQLVRSGVALLVTFPLVDSVLSYYEIDMARSESEAVLHHFNPLIQQQTVIQECAQWVGEGHPQLGTIEQVVWHRPLPERTRDRTLWHFARDVEFLGNVAGRLNRLGALGSPDEEATYAGLSVQLLGQSKIPVRWEVGPVEHSERPKLILTGERGTLTVEFNETGQAPLMVVSLGGESRREPIVELDPFAQAVKRFVPAVEAHDGASSTWLSALHAMELTDTIEISLRRGRMIEVHDQQLTEQLAFKGTMSAVGCGVLMVLPPLLLLFGWLAEQVGLPVAGFWPHVLLALLVIFLLFQLLPRLLLKSQPSGDQTQNSTASKSE